MLQMTCTGCIVEEIFNQKIAFTTMGFSLVISVNAEICFAVSDLPAVANIPLKTNTVPRYSIRQECVSCDQFAERYFSAGLDGTCDTPQNLQQLTEDPAFKPSFGYMQRERAQNMLKTRPCAPQGKKF
jgi:hypothetical protein